MGVRGTEDTVGSGAHFVELLLGAVGEEDAHFAIDFGDKHGAQLGAGISSIKLLDSDDFAIGTDSESAGKLIFGDDDLGFVIAIHISGGEGDGGESVDEGIGEAFSAFEGGFCIGLAEQDLHRSECGEECEIAPAILIGIDDADSVWLVRAADEFLRGRGEFFVGSAPLQADEADFALDRKSTRLNSSHSGISD